MRTGHRENREPSAWQGSNLQSQNSDDYQENSFELSLQSFKAHLIAPKGNGNGTRSSEPWDGIRQPLETHQCWVLNSPMAPRKTSKGHLGVLEGPAWGLLLAQFLELARASSTHFRQVYNSRGSVIPHSLHDWLLVVWVSVQMLSSGSLPVHHSKPQNLQPQPHPRHVFTSPSFIIFTALNTPEITSFIYSLT